MGYYRNTASVARNANWAGVTTGTITFCCKRVILALLNKHDEYIHALIDAKKRSAKDYIEKSTKCEVWKNGCLVANGTIVPLF